MPTIRVTIQAPAAEKAGVEDHLSEFGSFPLGVELVPYPGDPSVSPTHYGASITAVMDGPLDAACVAIPGLFAGSAVQAVQRTSPYWKAFNNAVHWIGWLNSQGLQPRVAS